MQWSFDERRYSRVTITIMAKCIGRGDIGCEARIVLVLTRMPTKYESSRRNAEPQKKVPSGPDNDMALYEFHIAISTH